MSENDKLNEPLSSYDRPTSFEDVWKLFLETEKQFKETDERLDKMFNKTDKKIRELSNLFTTQWGRLVESLVEGELINLLVERGLKVESVVQRRKGSRNGVNYEFDLIAENTDEIVIVEVKTTLRPDDVKHFLEKLKKAKIFMPVYKNMKIYGAVAYLTAVAGSEQMAEKAGLFVIKATGNSSKIINASDFKPKIF